MTSFPAWVLSAVEALREVGSWTGRTHVHKVLFLGAELADLKQPFDFELYRFGPYSFELDDEVRDLRVADLLNVDYPDPCYGPRYSAAEDWKESVGTLLDAGQRATLNRVCHAIGNRKSSDLELIATCCWAERREHMRSDPEIIARVRALKPRYDELQVSAQLREYRKLKIALGAQ